MAIFPATNQNKSSLTAPATSSSNFVNRVPFQAEKFAPSPPSPPSSPLTFFSIELGIGHTILISHCRCTRVEAGMKRGRPFNNHNRPVFKTRTIRRSIQERAIFRRVPNKRLNWKQRVQNTEKVGGGGLILYMWKKKK